MSNHSVPFNFSLNLLKYTARLVHFHASENPWKTHSTFSRNPLKRPASKNNNFREAEIFIICFDYRDQTWVKHKNGNRWTLTPPQLISLLYFPNRETCIPVFCYQMMMMMMMMMMTTTMCDLIAEETVLSPVTVLRPLCLLLFMFCPWSILYYVILHYSIWCIIFLYQAHYGWMYHIFYARFTSSKVF